MLTMNIHNYKFTYVLDIYHGKVSRYNNLLTELVEFEETE